MKYIIFLVLLTSTLFSADSKYLKEKDYSNNDLRIFVGLNANYSYLSSVKTTDHGMYSYGLYAGLPIFNKYEFILNKYDSVTKSFIYKQQSITFNFPLSSRKTRQVYLGISLGNGIVDFEDDTNNIDNNFYAIHIGKRFKYARNYYTRIELEYMKYNYENESNEYYGKDNAFIFNYGIEYRF